ncbi:type IV pilus modification protein PilV [Ferrimonas senticii]|uniref:type IV pilus modification protein PilV n=1 Tax=Ferrimonas senticii TaxID=394566 RepID=UPI00146BB0DB|nr:type IV pilus modification protein PilV [Ferrimonas senticii]
MTRQVGGLRCHQRGVTLIEVMVAAVVASIGLLGVFQLHTQAKRSSFDVASYAKATVMAADLLDRLRLNPTQIDDYVGSAYGAGSIVAPTVSCQQVAGITNQCSAAQLALWDRYQWDQQLLGAAVQRASTNIGAPPSVTGCVFVNGINVEVVISWRGMHQSSDGAAANSSDAQSCGTANAYRRQVVLASVVMDRL